MVNRTIFIPKCSDISYFLLYQTKSQENKRMVSCVFNFKYLSQIAHVGGVLKLSEPADFITDPGFENCPRFVGVIEQNKI